MAASKSSRSTGGAGRSASASTKSSAGAGKSTTKAKAPAKPNEGVTAAVEQLAHRVMQQLDAVMLTRERIQETLDEAAERGRVTRSDANLLVAELVKRGRAQTDDLLHDIEQLLERGRGQLGSATKRARRAEPVDRLVRGADRARRTVGVGPTFPIIGYDDLTAAQVRDRLTALGPAELRAVRDYERRRANRKSVLSAIDRALG